jgi:3-methyladenine DNA glycosylase Mpg
MASDTQKVGKDFFNRPVDEVARDLVGKILVRQMNTHQQCRMRIITTEAYGGGNNSSMPDRASHSHEEHKGNNNGAGQELEGGNLYIAYSRSNQGGAQRQLNITTGKDGDPQAVLVKECQLLYKDNIPNKEGDDNGFLSETKITQKLELNDVPIGGYNMDELSISVISDDDLVGADERDNVNDKRLWRFSIGRLLQVLLIILIIPTMLFASCSSGNEYVGQYIKVAEKDVEANDQKRILWIDSDFNEQYDELNTILADTGKELDELEKKLKLNVENKRSVQKFLGKFDVIVDSSEIDAFMKLHIEYPGSEEDEIRRYIVGYVNNTLDGMTLGSIMPSIYESDEYTKEIKDIISGKANSETAEEEKNNEVADGSFDAEEYTRNPDKHYGEIVTIEGQVVSTYNGYFHVRVDEKYYFDVIGNYSLANKNMLVGDRVRVTGKFILWIETYTLTVDPSSITVL